MKESGGRQKVLHVDDNYNFLELFKTIFNKWFEIHSAQMGQEAIEIMETEKFDAVITDYEMPDMNGMELFKILKEKHPNIPVIFFTGHGSEEVARSAFLEGISDYIIKDLNGFLNKARLVNSIKQAIEKKKAEIALRESEKKYRFLYDESQAINVLMDIEGIIMDANKACLKLMECGKEDLIGRSAFDCVVQGQREAVIASFMNDVEGKHTSSMLMDVTSFKNNLRKVLFGEGAVIVLNEDEEPYAVLVNGIDITDLFFTEEALDAIKEEILIKNRELTDFAYMVSQDMKSPLVLIKGYLEEIKRDSKKMPKYCDCVVEQSNRLLQFVDKLLDLARAGSTISSLIDINMETLIKRTYAIINDKNSRLIVNSPIPSVHGDYYRMSIVFENLIKNSIQHKDDQKEGHIIEIRGEKRENDIIFCFKDNGMGIEEKHLNKIFEIGFSSANPRRNGFGLTIARRIVEAHNGELWAKSQGKQKGTEFYIKLPVHNQEKPANN